MPSFFDILKEDLPEGDITPADFANILGAREEEREESFQVGDRKRIAEEKRQKQILEKLINETKEVIRRVKRGQEIGPSFLSGWNDLLNLSNNELRAKSLRKFNNKLKRPAATAEWRELKNLMNQRDGQDTNWDLWMGAIKEAFGYGKLTNRSLGKIRRYIDNPQDKEFAPKTPQKIIEINYASPIEQRYYKQDSERVNDDYEDIVSEWEIKVRTIKNNETLAEEAIEKAKLLGLTLRRLKEGWTENQQDNFWNNPETRRNIQSAFDHINASIKEYKKSIREQWKGLNILWDAIQMLTGKDADSIFNPSDYNFREIDQEVIEQYIELSKKKLANFIASLGDDEPDRERMEEEEWKQKVQTILQEEEE